MPELASPGLQPYAPEWRSSQPVKNSPTVSVNVQKMPRSSQGGKVKAFWELFRQNAVVNGDRILHQ
jgi:hypothetical protein